MCHHTELSHIEHVHRGEHHTADDQLLVDAIDGRRQYDILHRLGEAVAPDARGENIVKQLHHLLVVTGVKPGGRSVLQPREGHFGYEGLQTLPDHLWRPVAGRRMDTGIERIQKRRVSDVVTAGDGGIEHVHPSKQIVVETRHLGILISAPPVVSHQLVVCLDGVQPVGIHLMGMYGQEIVRRRDGLAEITLQQGIQNHIECFVLYHFFMYALARSISCCLGALACW